MPPQKLAGNRAQEPDHRLQLARIGCLGKASSSPEKSGRAAIRHTPYRAGKTDPGRAAKTDRKRRPKLWEEWLAPRGRGGGRIQSAVGRGNRPISDRHTISSPRSGQVTLKTESVRALSDADLACLSWSSYQSEAVWVSLHQHRCFGGIKGALPAVIHPTKTLPAKSSL